MQRRSFLQGMTALGAAAGLPLGARAANKAAYDPSAKFDLRVSEVPFRKNSAGRDVSSTAWRRSYSASRQASFGPFRLPS